MTELNRQKNLEAISIGELNHYIDELIEGIAFNKYMQEKYVDEEEEIELYSDTINLLNEQLELAYTVLKNKTQNKSGGLYNPQLSSDHYSKKVKKSKKVRKSRMGRFPHKRR